MDFRSEILQALRLAMIHHLKLLEGEVFLSDRFYDAGGNLWARKLVKEFLENGLIKPAELHDAVSEGIVLYGLQMYDRVRDFKVKPDHVESPEALAYALLSGRIPPMDVRRIEFDHGETLQSFTRRAEGLLQRVMESLQQEPKSPQVGQPEGVHDTAPHN